MYFHPAHITSRTFMPRWDEARPSEEFYRLLAPDGTLRGERPDLNEDRLLRLYRTMRLARRFDERATSLQRRGEISILSSSVGEEAIPVGSAAALEPGDWCFYTYRQTPATLYWGASLARTVASLMGAEPETVDEHLPVGEEGAPEVNFPPVYIPLAANVTNAVGSAMADRFAGTDAVTLSYVGDGSTSQGGFYEALNFAGVFEAPAVTICHNNQWAISVPAHRQTAAETFAKKAEAAGIPHERVDGNDVLGVYEVTREAVQQARDGGGPSFIECVTYRRGDHNTADDARAYRSEEEREYWEERDPIDRFETYLESEGVLDADRRESIEVEVEERIAEAVDRAREVPESDPQRMFDNHLSGSSWNERRQRAELRAELEGRNPFTDVAGAGENEP